MTRNYTVEWPQTMLVRDTIDVLSEDPRVFIVTYRGVDGSVFRCRFRQRSNPIGFHVRLPGDGRVSADRD